MVHRGLSVATAMIQASRRALESELYQEHHDPLIILISPQQTVDGACPVLLSIFWARRSKAVAS